MTRINLAKYGFVRWPEEDFTDDGSKFNCYRAGKKVRVSKLVVGGQAYLSIASTVGNGTLPYDVYSKLPHYHDANWKWNGVPVAGLADQDIADFYYACVEYEKEYEAMEASIQYPTLKEIEDKAVRITAKALCEMATIESLMAKYAVEAAIKFSPYEWKQVQEYTKNLMADLKRYNPETYPQTIVGTSRSFGFVKPEYNMEESYWFTSLKKLFEKYCMN